MKNEELKKKRQNEEENGRSLNKKERSHVYQSHYLILEILQAKKKSKATLRGMPWVKLTINCGKFKEL